MLPFDIPNGAKHERKSLVSLSLRIQGGVLTTLLSLGRRDGPFFCTPYLTTRCTFAFVSFSASAHLPRHSTRTPSCRLVTHVIGPCKTTGTPGATTCTTLMTSHRPHSPRSCPQGTGKCTLMNFCVQWAPRVHETFPRSMCAQGSAQVDPRMCPQHPYGAAGRVERGNQDSREATALPLQNVMMHVMAYCTTTASILPCLCLLESSHFSVRGFGPWLRTNASAL